MKKSHFLAWAEFLTKTAEQEVGNFSALCDYQIKHVCCEFWVCFTTHCFNQVWRPCFKGCMNTKGGWYWSTAAQQLISRPTFTLLFRKYSMKHLVHYHKKITYYHKKRRTAFVFQHCQRNTMVLGMVWSGGVLQASHSSGKGQEVAENVKAANCSSAP